MSNQKFPSKILGWIQVSQGDAYAPPDYNLIVYTQNELDSFLYHMKTTNTSLRIEEHKPKLKELTRLNFFEKLSYAIPFKTQISDILVDIIKLITGFVIGYFTKQLMQ